MNTPQDTPGDPPTPPNPTLGRRAGYHLDENGNVTGIWFTMEVDHFVEYTDVVITDPAELAKLRKPAS